MLRALLPSWMRWDADDDQGRALIREDTRAVLKDVNREERRHKGFSFVVAVCFTINFIMGSGFLGVPSGFYRGGAVAGVVLMLAVTYVANITKNFVIDAMVRAEAIIQDDVFGTPAPELDAGSPPPETPREHGLSPSRSRSSLVDSAADARQYGEGARISGGGAGPSPSSRSRTDPRGWQQPQGRPQEQARGPPGPMDHVVHLRVARAVPAFEITGRKFEVTELCRIFLGDRAQRLYVVLLCLYMYGALWAYAAVFASSFATFFSVTGDPYRFFALAFGCVVVFCSCLDLREQWALQVAMSAARFTIIFLMVLTVAVAASNSDKPYFVDVPAGGRRHWSWVDFSGIPYLIPILVYSQIFHHSIPGLAQPLRDKARVREMFTAAFSVTASFYVAIGLAITVYMGSDVDEQCNLNWSGYLGDHAGLRPHANDTARVLLSAGAGGDNVGQPWYAQVVVYTVLLFPGIDVLSAYPLCAITLGSNLMSAYYGREVARYERFRRYRLPFRVLASLPPVVGAVFVKSLGTILDFTGLIGFGIIFFVPILLQHHSRKVCIARWGEALGAKTPYTQPRAASPPMLVALSVGSVVCFLVALVDLCLRLAN